MTKINQNNQKVNPIRFELVDEDTKAASVSPIVGLVYARSSCCNRLMAERLFIQSGKISHGIRECLYCHKIVEKWDKKKKVWIKLEDKKVKP